jgi:MFS family permease
MKPLLRRIYAAQLSTAIGDGAVLTTATLFFAVILGFGEGVVGPALGGGALLGLVLSVPLGRLADRIGLARAAAGFSVVAAASMVLFAIAASPAVYVAGALCWGVAQANLLPLRQALAASQVPLEGRVRLRAVLHTLLNIGMGLGAAWGAVAVALDLRAVFVATFLVHGAICLATGAVYAFLHASARGMPVLPGAESAAWRDRRLLGLTGLAGLLQLSIPILGVLTPIWIVTRTAAPEWLPAVALTMNMLVVVAVQLRWASWVSSASRARVSAFVAGAAAVLACFTLGLAPLLGGVGASVAALVGILFITVTEVCAGAASWFRLTQLSPVGRQGEFQAVFSTSTTIARIIGPAVLLPVVVAVGLPAWVALGLVIAGAAGALAGVLRRSAPAAV